MKKILYVVTNETMPGLVKIGITKDINKRLKELYNTNVAEPFVCEYAVECEDALSIEKKLHEVIFSEERVNIKREFFKVSLDKVIGVLSLLGEDVKDKLLNENIHEDINLDIDDLENELIEEGYQDDTLFYLSCKDCSAIMKVVDGFYILKKGSKIRLNETNSFCDNRYIGDRRRRQDIFKNKSTILDKNNIAILTEDIMCNSASSAAQISTGRSANGQTEWKTKEGLTFREHFLKALENSSL